MLFDTLPLIKKTFKSTAEARNEIGEIAAQYACRALGMTPLAVDGRQEICPDADWNGRKVEIKAVAKGRAILYAFRAEKESRHFGKGYIYVFVKHSCRITVKTTAEIIEHFTANPPVLLITSLAGVLKLVEGREPRAFNKNIDEASRNGWEREGYRDGGWQFSINKAPVFYETKAFFSWNNRATSTTILHSYLNQ